MKAAEKLAYLSFLVFLISGISVIQLESYGEETAKLQSDEATESMALNTLGRMPLHFIENQGQLDEEVKYYSRRGGKTVYFTQDGIVFDLLRRQKASPTDILEDPRESESPLPSDRLVFTLGFEGVLDGVSIKGETQQEGKVNYFIGNDKSKWQTNIPTYKDVIYKDLYEGIDLKVYGKGRVLELEYIVTPGTDPGKILLSYEGIEDLIISNQGELLIQTFFGEFKEGKPYIYQMIDDEMVLVDGNFKLAKSQPKSATGSKIFSYGFQIASYNDEYPLIIDPTSDYSTYLGGSAQDQARGIAVDGSGNAYVTGVTESTDFPTQNAYQGTVGGSSDGFVTKFTASGSALSYSTYLGGTGGDMCFGIAVDGSENAYVAGSTSSTDFPTHNAYQGTLAGSFFPEDGFVTKFMASGSALSYSTYLGGTGLDRCNGIAVDGSGNAYVAGFTNSTDFPTQNAYQGTHAGGVFFPDDGFVTKFTASGSALSYSTYLGGTGSDGCNGIAVDGSGNAYVAGSTSSTDFPTQNAYQGTRGGIKNNTDSFLTKFTSSGSALSYSTYLGKSGSDFCNGIAVDGSGNAIIAGWTDSTDFPTQSAYQGTYAGGPNDGFVTKFTASGNTLSYSTYLGGSSLDAVMGVAADGSGNAYVAGITDSTDFPTQDPYQGTHAGGSHDGFVTKIAASGSALSYSSYMGGSGNDTCLGIAVDGSGDAYVTGYTISTDFPTQNPYQVNIAGDWDAFVFKLGEESTLVELLYFKATPTKRKVILEWKTASEIDNAGFHLWRSDNRDGVYARITRELIPAQGGPTWGAEYFFSDESVVRGQTYYYRLEDIDLYGQSIFRGPISATVIR